MQCELCGGLVTWRGPLSALTHTECESCGRQNCQIVEVNPNEDEPCQETFVGHSELASAYRAHTAGPKAVKDSEGTVWLYFESPSGKKAAISLEVLAAERGPLISQTIREWADAL